MPSSEAPTCAVNASAIVCPALPIDTTNTCEYECKSYRSSQTRSTPRSQCTWRANALAIEASARAWKKIARAVSRIWRNCDSRSASDINEDYSDSSSSRAVSSQHAAKTPEGEQPRAFSAVNDDMTYGREVTACFSQLSIASRNSRRR